MCKTKMEGSARILDRRLLASFIEYAAEGKVTAIEWNRFMVNHYSDDLMERARVECIRFCAGHSGTIVLEQKESLYQLARELRESPEE